MKKNQEKNIREYKEIFINESEYISKLLSNFDKLTIHKSKSMKTGAFKSKKDRKNNNSKELRSISNDLKSFISSRTMIHGMKKRKRVKFRSKLIELVEIESYKPYFVEMGEEVEDDNNTNDLLIIKKKNEVEEIPIKSNFNHKLNSNNENRVKCCVCDIF